MSVTTILATLILLASSATPRRVFETLYEWNFVNFELPHVDYVPENNLFTGIEVYWDRIFLALPNLRSGVPASLAWLPRPDQHTGAFLGQSPALQPYPGLEWQGTAGNCTGLVSVYRVRIDRCDRLWVLDSGVITTLDNYTPACPPKIMVFDLKTDRLVRNIVLPREVLRPNSLLTNLEIDYEIVKGDFYGYQKPTQTCDDAFVYMTDTANAAIVVYDVKKDEAWRVFHPTMLPHPDHCTHVIAGENFTLPDAVVGIALSPESSIQSTIIDPYGNPTYGGQRVLYFQPFAGLRIFSIPTAILQTPPSIDTDLQIKLIFEKTSQSASLAADPNDGTLYFNPITELALASLRPGSRHAQIVLQDADKLQFSSDILFTPRDNYNIWFLSSKFQKFFRKTYDPHTVNFRIMRLAKVSTPAASAPIRIQAPAPIAIPHYSSPSPSYKNSLFYY